MFRFPLRIYLRNPEVNVQYFGLLKEFLEEFLEDVMEDVLSKFPTLNGSRRPYPPPRSRPQPPAPAAALRDVGGGGSREARKNVWNYFGSFS